MSTKKWEVSAIDKEKAVELAEGYGLPPFLALLLVIRGITEREKIDAFLYGGEFSDPMESVDMDQAVERIAQALENLEKIKL